jgi:hydroxymethylbilane synthase
MDSGQYSALILAAAGLQRLGIVRPSYCFSVREMVPAAGQGILAIQGRRAEDYAFLDAVRDPVTEAEAGIEQRIIRALGGTCQTPAGAYAKITGGEIFIIGWFARIKPDQTEDVERQDHSGQCEIPQAVSAECTGSTDQAEKLAEKLAEQLLNATEQVPSTK